MAALEDTNISYEELADLEREFDDAETEILRQQVTLTQELFDRRQKTVSQIPHFWQLVLEQAPQDIDQYIQPSDSNVLLSHLTSISVSHFELSTDPRSVSITFEFEPNEYFADTKLEKKFWSRRAKDGWVGLVSEPVPIQWKKDKDLTGGLLGLVCKAWEANKDKKTEAGKLSSQQKALQKKIESTGMGGLSFFAWFGFIGRHISAEESAEATKAEKERREAIKAGKEPASCCADGEEHDHDHDGAEDALEQEMALEIFPDGDDLAIAFTQDLWPGAIKYFIQAQERDMMSDADFEDFEGSDDDEEAPELVETNGEEPPKKKTKRS